MDIVRVSTVAAQECVRQQVGLDRVAMLLNGYSYLSESDRLDSTAVFNLAEVIEPSNRGLLRRTPVTFQNGGSSASPDVIVSAFQSLMNNQPDPNDFDIDNWIQQFLWVHPFTDGNGRTAWVLWNWFRNTMDSPLTLPNFFGEQLV